MWNLQRPLVSAGVFVAGAFVLTTVLGVPSNLQDFAMEGAYIAASTFGSDALHDFLRMYPTGVTSAVVVGVMNAGLQAVGRSSSNYTSNFVSGAVTDLASGYVEPMIYSRNEVPEAPIEGGVSTA